MKFELHDNKVRIIDEDGWLVVALTIEQAWEFYRWWIDGICPVCANDINVGEIICDDCFEQAKTYRL